MHAYVNGVGGWVKLSSWTNLNPAAKSEQLVFVTNYNAKIREITNMQSSSKNVDS